MFNPLTRAIRTIFVDDNGIGANKGSGEIQSLLEQDRLVIARLHTLDNVIYGMPTYYDSAEKVIWFQCTDVTNNQIQIVGIDANAEFVYYTGE